MLKYFLNFLTIKLSFKLLSISNLNISTNSKAYSGSPLKLIKYLSLLVLILIASVPNTKAFIFLIGKIYKFLGF